MTTAHVQIEPVTGLDPSREDLFLGWAAVYDASGRHGLGDAHSSWGVEELRELERSTGQRRLAWAALCDGRVVGAVLVVMPLHDNRTTAQTSLAVHPDHRRDGIGSRLLVTAEEAARAQGRTVLVAVTEWAVDGQDGGAGFAARHGYSAAQSTLRSALSLPADPDRLQAVLSAAGGDAYTMQSCWDGIPERWLVGRAELSRRMSTDIPHGDLLLEEEVWDEERVRESYARIAGMGRRVVDTFAVEQETGRLVGYTQVQVGCPGDLGYQQDTLVVREHRGHGLGLRLKAASTVAVMAELPDVTRIRTWNADDNLHMLAVNRELGSQADAWLRVWQKAV
ncbi:MAG: GNAT family N-acetyltransferase [Pedococcus sp.]